MRRERNLSQKSVRGFADALKLSGRERSYFIAMTNGSEYARAAQPRLKYGGSTFSIDARTYPKFTGFSGLPPGSTIESITPEIIDGRAGQFANYLEPHAGQVIAFRSEDYFYTTLAAIEVISVKENEITMKLRALKRYRTEFAAR